MTLMSGQPHILVLSAHGQLMDRRIIAESNALAASGRAVTLVTVPTAGCEDLAGAIRLVVGRPGEGGGPLKRLHSRLPGLVRRPLGKLYRRIRPCPAKDMVAYFMATTPPGPYDAIHCHDLQTLPAGLSLLARQGGGAKVLYDSHELFPLQYPPGRLRRAWQAIERESIGRADHVITVNESVAGEIAREYGLPRPTVLYNSCHYAPVHGDAARFAAHFGLPTDSPSVAPRETHGQDAHATFRVMFQGNWTTQRNVEALVLAFDTLGDGFHLFLLGGGPAEKRVRRLAGRGRWRNVHLGPWVAAQEMMGFLSHVQAGIIPYQGGLPNNYFCSPNKLFEYIEAGVPVCAADLPELRRIVACGIGRVYTMETADPIAQALRDLANRCRGGEFGAEASAAARREYGWAAQARCLLKVYEQLGV